MPHRSAFYGQVWRVPEIPGRLFGPALKPSSSQAEPAIDQVWAKLTGWIKKFIQLGALGVILITIAEMYGVNLINVKTLILSQEGGIGMAGLGFLYSKL
jgi:hypothetical protein